MMKCLYFLLFVAASQAYVSEESRETQDIPRPHLTRITFVDKPSLGFVVDWTRVDTNEDSDPVLGYKLKVWEHSKIHQYKYETVNDNDMRDEDCDSSKSSDSEQRTTHKPKELFIHGADRTSARVDDIEEGITYESRVQAYTRNGDGPLSKPMRIKVVAKETDRQRDLYTME